MPGGGVAYGVVSDGVAVIGGEQIRHPHRCSIKAGGRGSLPSVGLEKLMRRWGRSLKSNINSDLLIYNLHIKVKFCVQPLTKMKEFGREKYYRSFHIANPYVKVNFPLGITRTGKLTEDIDIAYN